MIVLTVGLSSVSHASEVVDCVSALKTRFNFMNGHAARACTGVRNASEVVDCVSTSKLVLTSWMVKPRMPVSALAMLPT